MPAIYFHEFEGFKDPTYDGTVLVRNRTEKARLGGAVSASVGEPQPDARAERVRTPKNLVWRRGG